MSKRKSSFASACLLGFGLLACGGCGQTPVQAPNPGTVALRSSEKSERRSLSVTVYNQNFGLVRETRKVPLGRGRVELSFRDVAASLQPESVGIKNVGAKGGLSVLEQNYRYDLLTPAKLLEKFVGKRITVYRENEVTGLEERKDAEVVSAVDGAVLRIDGQLTSNFRGRLAFAELPANLVAEPTLVWLLDSGLPEQTLEVSYLTQNLNWRADYVLTLDAAQAHADLTGWVTLDNRSGASYENAELRLIAGDVQRLAPREVATSGVLRGGSVAIGNMMREENLFEYHLYGLSRPTTLLDREQKQVLLLSAAQVVAKKVLVFPGSYGFYQGDFGQFGLGRHAEVFLELVNSEQNQLGMPLPQGTLRVYQATANGAPEFVGENSIGHTPRDEKVRLKLGEAFDVIVDHVQKQWTELSRCASEGDYQVEVRNHKDTAEVVEVMEPAGLGAELLSASLPFERVDASTFRFVVTVPAHGKTQVSYRFRLVRC